MEEREEGSRGKWVLRESTVPVSFLYTYMYVHVQHWTCVCEKCSQEGIEVADKEGKGKDSGSCSTKQTHYKAPTTQAFAAQEVREKGESDAVLRKLDSTVSSTNR